jgi:hypothetical protein
MNTILSCCRKNGLAALRFLLGLRDAAVVLAPHALRWNRRAFAGVVLLAGFQEKRHALAISHGTHRLDARDRRR